MHVGVIYMHVMHGYDDWKLLIGSSSKPRFISYAMVLHGIYRRNDKFPRCHEMSGPLLHASTSSIFLSV